MDEVKNQINQGDAVMLSMFEAGAHFGYSRTRRHPSMKDVMFGVKNRVELFDLEKTKGYLEKAKAFAENIGASGKQILFVSGKHEAKQVFMNEISRLNTPFVAGRWIGGALTNFGQIKTRIAKLVDLREKRAKGELVKYTKKERLLIDREITKLEGMFDGLLPMKEMPGAVFVIDSKKEKTVVGEAKKMRIPVISLSGSDCDLGEVEYPIPANDSSSSSIAYFVKAIAEAYKMGKTRFVVPQISEKK